MTTGSEPNNTNFTVFIRLPFPRGDFVDPPPVDWNASKDQELWDILSRPSKGDDLDCMCLIAGRLQHHFTFVEEPLTLLQGNTCNVTSHPRAERFDVTLQFLLQQAAWLYDRQLSQVRAQMRKVGTTQSNSPSPAPGSVSGSTALGGPASKGTAAPAPRGHARQVSQPKEVPPKVTSDQGRRTSSTSTTTINHFRGSRDPSRTENPTADGKEQRLESYPRRPSVMKQEHPPAASFLRSPPLEEEDLSSSSEESDSEEEANRRVPRFRRFGKFSTQRAGLRDDEEDEDDDTPAFLPLSHETEQPGPRDRPGHELNATLRLDAERAAEARRRTADRSGSRAPVASESSTSSMGSEVPVNLPQDEHRRTGQVAGALSPHRAAEPPRVSPRKSTASGRETSDGTPSMGSSFSDLDDASVTQSALEEALMSNMQHGGMASRMSTISQALRSRYLQ